MGIGKSKEYIKGDSFFFVSKNCFFTFRMYLNRLNTKLPNNYKVDFVLEIDSRKYNHFLKTYSICIVDYLLVNKFKHDRISLSFSYKGICESYMGLSDYENNYNLILYYKDHDTTGYNFVSNLYMSLENIFDFKPKIQNFIDNLESFLENNKYNLDFKFHKCNPPHKINIPHFLHIEVGYSKKSKMMLIYLYHQSTRFITMVERHGEKFKLYRNDSSRLVIKKNSIMFPRFDYESPDGTECIISNLYQVEGRKEYEAIRKELKISIMNLIQNSC